MARGPTAEVEGGGVLAPFQLPERLRWQPEHQQSLRLESDFLFKQRHAAEDQ